MVHLSKHILLIRVFIKNSSNVYYLVYLKIYIFFINLVYFHNPNEFLQNIIIIGNQPA